MITRVGHAEFSVNGLARRIFFFHIKTQSLCLRIVAGQGFNMPVEFFENPLPSVIRVNVDTLNPPQVAVAPIAPLISDHRLPDHRTLNLRDKVTALVRLEQSPLNAFSDGFGV